MSNQEIICPSCGYYCLGKGGLGCIDKPGLTSETNKDLTGMEEDLEDEISELEFDNIFDLIAEDPNDAAAMKFRADLLLAIRDMFEQKTRSD